MHVATLILLIIASLATGYRVVQIRRDSKHPQ